MQDTIRAGWPNPNRNSFKVPFELARRHLAAEADLELQYAEFMGAAAEFDALQAGDIEVAFATAPQVLELGSAGVDLRLAVGFLQRQTFRLIATRDVESPADLAGRPVSYQPGGGISEQALRYTVAQAGLDPDRDLELVEMLPIPEIRTALLEGTVDAAPLGVDTALDFMQDHPDRFHILADSALRAMEPAYVVGWVTTTEILEERRPLLEGYRDAMISGYAEAYERSAEDLAEVARSMKFLGDHHIEALAESLQVYQTSAVWPVEGFVEEASWNRTLEDLADVGLVEQGLSATLPPTI